APFAGRIVQDAPELAVDGVARGECALQIHGTDDIAQRGDRELLDGLQVAGDLVGGRPRIRNLEVQHGVDLYDEVVLGDHRLRAEGDDLLAQVDFRVDPVDIWNDEVEPGLQRTIVAAEPLYIASTCLRHDAHRAEHCEYDEYCQQQPRDQQA